MLDRILQEAPSKFDQQFLEWIRRVGDALIIGFANWYPADAEGVQEYIRTRGQQVPEELKLYYEHADPFGTLRDGWRWWHEREEEYQTVWNHTLVNTLEVTPDEAERLVNVSPSLWPIDCFERTSDRVGFVWRDDELAVIELDLQEGGRGKPLSIGLRNYFLQSIVVEALAEEELEPVDFAKLRQHPAVLKVSGWPTETPFPEHIALTIDRLLG